MLSERTAEFPSAHSYRLGLSKNYYALASVLLEAGRLQEGEAAVRAGDTSMEIVTAMPSADHPPYWPVGETLYHSACVHAVASAGLKGDGALADRQAARAVQLLRRGFAKGYFDIGHMVQDSDLAPIRSRPDYLELIWDLAECPPAADSPGQQPTTVGRPW